MGRTDTTVTRYSCDECREEFPLHHEWYGFSRGKNSPVTYSNQLFCSKNCGENWLRAQTRWLQGLTVIEMRSRFPDRPYETIGNTD